MNSKHLLCLHNYVSYVIIWNFNIFVVVDVVVVVVVVVALTFVEELTIL